jgi:hypothetical protein
MKTLLRYTKDNQSLSFYFFKFFLGLFNMLFNIYPIYSAFTAFAAFIEAFLALPIQVWRGNISIEGLSF